MPSSVIAKKAAIVQMLHPKDARTFPEYVSNVFIPYIMSKLRNATRFDFVWDRCVETHWKVWQWQSVGNRGVGSKFLLVRLILIT